MSNICYRIKGQLEDEFSTTYDYKNAKRIAKRICKEKGSAIIEYYNDELEMVVDEELYEFNNNY